MPKLERLAIYSVRKVQAFYVVREIHKQIERSEVNLVTSPLIESLRRLRLLPVNEENVR